MGLGSSIDIGEDLAKSKKVCIKELNPDELVRKEREAVEKKKNIPKTGSDKIRLKKYGGDNFFAKVGDFIEKRHVAILLIICLFAGCFVLSQPVFFKGIDSYTKTSILNNLEKQIQLKIDLDYPHVSKLERLRLAKRQFEITQNRQDVQQKIAKEVNNLRDLYKDISGHAYIYGVDSYLFLTKAKNLIDYGTLGDKNTFYFKGGDIVNSLRESPKGVMPNNSFLSYLEYYTYQFTRFIGWSLEKTAFWLPLLFGLLSITLVFLIGKKIINPIGGFFSAFIFALHQRFFTLNYAGFADTNYLNIFFSLFLILLFVNFLDFKLKKSAICFLLAIPITLLFKWVWHGYLYIFAVFFGYFILYVVVYLLRNFRSKRNKWLLASLCFGVLIIGFYLRTTNFFSIVKNRLLPYTVPSGFFRTGMENIVELKSVSFGTLFQAMGGYLFWLLFIIAFGYSLFKIFKNSNHKYYLLLIVWFIPTLIAGALSSRFLFYAAPSFCLLAGSGISLLFPLLFNLFDSTHLEIRERTWKGFIFFVFIIIICLYVKSDVLRLNDYYPPMNDAIFETANFIRLNSKENAIIDTWWDHGYMYQYYAKRGTIFDPGSFGGPRQFWSSKAFLEKSPVIAKQIWQMQNCGRDWEVKDISELVKNTDCNNPGFVVVSEDMLGKIYEMKASIENREMVNLANRIKKISKQEALAILKNKLNLTESEAEIKYKELLNFKDTAQDVKVSRLSQCAENSGIILCDNGYKIQNNEVTYKNQHPVVFYDYSKNKQLKINYPNSKADFAFILYNVGNNFYSFMIDAELADTMIIRMFAGDIIEGFEKVYSTEYPVQIRTYKTAEDK